MILNNAFGHQTMHWRAQRLGVSRVNDKPFDFGELREAVYETLHQRTRRAS